jgi:hypothetical protein
MNLSILPTQELSSSISYEFLLIRVADPLGNRAHARSLLQSIPLGAHSKCHRCQVDVGRSWPLCPLIPDASTCSFCSHTLNRKEFSGWMDVGLVDA